MIFCGQCGFQLPSGVTRCPRCGTPVDTAVNVVGDAHTDDPTVASPSLHPDQLPQQQAMPPAGSYTPNNQQQRLVLRPGSSGPEYSTQQRPYDPTSQMNVSNYPTNTPAHPGYGTQGAGNYQAQNVPPNYATQSGGNYHTPHPVFAGTPQQNQYNYQPQEAVHGHSRGRITGLVLILFGLLFILGAIVLFTLQHHSSSNGGTGNVGTPVSSTQTAQPSTQQAQAVIQQYYDDINKHDYNAAYALWQQYPQSLAAFSSGFQNTLNDQLTIDRVVQQPDGTVKITVTVNAVEQTNGGGQKQSTYHINYQLARQPDNSWKIIHGTGTPA